MAKFSDIFDADQSTADALNVVVIRYPNSVETTYHFNRPLDVTHGQTRFKLTGTELTVDTYGEQFTPAPESLEVAQRLRGVNGLVVSESSVDSITISTYAVYVRKLVAVPDDEFDRDVITKLAEHFGVELDDVNVEIDNQRNRQFFTSDDYFAAYKEVGDLGGEEIDIKE